MVFRTDIFRKLSLGAPAYLPIQVQGFNSTESNPTNLTDNDKQGKEREKRKRKQKEQYYYNVF